MTGPNSEPPAKSRRSELLFWGFALLALLLMLGYNPLWTSEDRWAEIVREMRLTGDWIHPALNGLVYLDKPQLTYWLTALVSAPFPVLDEFLIRLPGVLAALLALWGTLLLGRTLYDETTARTAAWLLLSSYAFIFWARLAQADIANLAAIVLAVAWFMRCRERAGFWSYLLFYLICFAGALAKGLPALVMPFVIIAPFLWRDGCWKRHLKLSNFLAVIPAALIYAAPLYLAQALPYAPGYLQPDLSGWELVWRENIVRVFQPFDHDDEPFFCYLYQLPRCLAPWSLLVVAGVAGLIANWKKLRPETRDLAVGTLLMFVLFSASGSRRWYYIMPAMPFTLLLTARALAGAGREKWNLLVLKIMRYAIIVAAAVGVISLLLLPFWFQFLKFAPPWPFVVGMPVLGALTLLVMFSEEVGRHRFPERLTGMPQPVAAVILGGAILSCGFFAVLFPAWGELRTEKPLLQQLRAELPPECELVLWYREALPKVNFYLDLKKPMRIIGNSEQLRETMAEFGERPWAILTYNHTRYARALHESAAECGLNWDPEHPDWLEARQPFEKESARKLAVWLINKKGKHHE